MREVRLAPIDLADTAQELSAVTMNVPAVGGPIKARSWIQVAKVGNFKGHPMGPFEFTPEVFDKMIMNFIRTSNREVPVDFEHATEMPAYAGNIPSQGAPATGWIIQLDNRKDAGLWGLVDWMDPGLTYIREGRYKYFSPAVVFEYTDQVSGEDAGPTLVSGALTNRPFLDGMAPVTAKAVPFHSYPPVEGAWDASAAEGRLRKWASSDGSGSKEKMNWAKYQDGFAWYDSTNAEDFGSYKLPHHDIVNGKIVTNHRGTSAALAAVNGARGGVSIPTADLAAVRAHLEKHLAQFKSVKSSRENIMGMDELLKALALAMGEKEPYGSAEAAISKIADMSASHKELSSKMAEMKAEADKKDKADAESEVDNLVRDGTFQASQRSQVLEQRLTNPTGFKAIVTALTSRKSKTPPPVQTPAVITAADEKALTSSTAPNGGTPPNPPAATAVQLRWSDKVHERAVKLSQEKPEQFLNGKKNVPNASAYEAAERQLLAENKGAAQ